MLLHPETIRASLSQARPASGESSRRNLTPENVHKFRTSSRRVEVLVADLADNRSRNDKKLLKLLGRLRKKAGRVRDLDVQSAALRSLKIPQEPGASRNSCVRWRRTAPSAGKETGQVPGQENRDRSAQAPEATAASLEIPRMPTLERWPGKSWANWKSIRARSPKKPCISSGSPASGHVTSRNSQARMPKPPV